MDQGKDPQAVPSPSPSPPSTTIDKTDTRISTAAHINDASSGFDTDQPEAQTGVQNIEAVTSTWTTSSLVIAYVMIWVIYFVMLMQQGALATLTPFVTSTFQQHSLTPTVAVISGIIGGVFKLTLAKILDVFGRPQGYLLSIFIATLGLVMMAACNSVETYAAAQVFYTVGQNALLYSISIFVADTSSLRNRGLMLAFTSSPNLITTWLSGPISQAYLIGPGWRWAFGTFSIVVPLFTLPLFGLFAYNLTKAKRLGVISKRTSQRTKLESLSYYCQEFDAVGLFLMSAGLALFLLPFNIYSMQEEGWRSPLIVCLLVFGVVLLIAFVIWEKAFAPITFIPYSLLLDRTVIGACGLSAVLFVSYFIWNNFFSSFLMVVNNLDVTKASYVYNIYAIGNTLWGLVVGWIVHRTGRFKIITLWFAIPLHIFGMGLMIHFRQSDQNIGFIILCQILIAIAGGTVIVTAGLAAMAAASHQHVAVVLATEAMFAEIGGAIGLTVSAAIWQDVFAKKLMENLPTEELANFLPIHSDLATQLMYPVGSATRKALQLAYGEAQKMMLIAATAIWVVGFVATFAWRDINVKTLKQVKGQVV
ncbi:MFS siderochrome iron transporter 1 [Colletotrichum sp. SAR11_240]|nr:MFS siderochrome iron transporter 1 [Colletotrichum sp. SAR11_240]